MVQNQYVDLKSQTWVIPVFEMVAWEILFLVSFYYEVDGILIIRAVRPVSRIYNQGT